MQELKLVSQAAAAYKKRSLTAEQQAQDLSSLLSQARSANTEALQVIRAAVFSCCSTQNRDLKLLALCATSRNFVQLCVTFCD